MIIREAKENDAPAMLSARYAAIHEKAGSHYSPDMVHAWAPEETTPERLEKLKSQIRDKSWFTLVATGNDNALIGFGQVCLEENKLGALYVRRNNHGSVGAKILKRLLDYARLKNILFLETESSLNAEEFYKNAGFKAIEYQKHPKGDRIKMRLISYATDKTHWLNWQHEYYWGAFYLFPPSEILKQVDGLREKHDPISAKHCQAHVSLSDTLQGAITDEQLKELRDSLSKLEPFVIEYGPIRIYPPYPGVCFDIRPADKFFALRETLHQTSLFAGHPLKRRNIPPHMTVAEFGLDMKQSESLCNRLKKDVPSGHWLCEGVSLAVPDNNFHFKEVLYIPFNSV